MLAQAGIRVPQADFRPGDLHDLPLADGCRDIVVCALALNHVPALRPVMTEFARVLRPGGIW
jgi:ubiquinone/menaquinone biosynthesis C-methylase UbiE